MMTSMCFLKSYSTLGQALIEDFNLNRTWIKKRMGSQLSKIKILARKEVQLPLDIVNHGMIFPHYNGPPIQIIEESKDFLALYKPTEIHSHPLVYFEQDNVLSFLRMIRPSLLQINSGQMDRGLLYRLDYGTSGVIIYAKNKEAFESCRKHFHQIMKKKIYRAWVHGQFIGMKIYEDLLTPIGPKGGQMVVSAMGEPAVLSVQEIYWDKEKKVSLVEIELSTGVRHQIRAQMSYHGHPLVGDTLYGGSHAKRLMLHCFQYQLEYEKSNFFARADSYEFERPIK